MKWPWKHGEDRERPDPDRARADLEAARAQRPEVEALAAKLRAHVVANNFAANVFALDPRRKR